MAENSGQSFCTNCGAELAPGAAFCASCGTTVGGRSGAVANVGGGSADLEFRGTALQALGYGLWGYVLMMLIIPYGWGVSAWTGWYIRSLGFSDGRTATFSGRGSQIWGYFILIFVLGFLLGWIPIIGNVIYLLLAMRIQLAVIRWFFSEIRLSTGQSPRFTGEYWPLFGWYLLWSLSFITIIGWAWVAAAGLRSVCRKVQLQEEHLEFNGAGLDILWRAIVVLVR